MPGKKSKQPKAAPRPPAIPPPAADGLPEPERVVKTRVGEVVQDLIDFGGATAVEAHQESGDTWVVSAMR